MEIMKCTRALLVAAALIIAFIGHPAAGSDALDRMVLFKDFSTGRFELLKQKLYTGMMQELDSAEGITIEITATNLSHSLGGRFSRIIITVNNAVIEGMCVREAFFDFNEPAIDLAMLWNEEKLRLHSSGEIGMNLVVYEDDINIFLKEKAAKLKVNKPEISLRPGTIFLKGSARWWIIQSSFWAKGTFFIQDGKKIFFNPKKLEISKVKMPSMVIKKLVQRINPVLDLSKLPFDVILKTIKLENSKMIITSY